VAAERPGTRAALGAASRYGLGGSSSSDADHGTKPGGRGSVYGAPCCAQIATSRVASYGCPHSGHVPAWESVETSYPQCVHRRNREAKSARRIRRTRQCQNGSSTTTGVRPNTIGTSRYAPPPGRPRRLRKTSHASAASAKPTAVMAHNQTARRMTGGVGGDSSGVCPDMPLEF
jgi:hypothetical protein